MAYVCERCEDGSWQCGEDDVPLCGGGGGVPWVKMNVITIPVGVGRELAICVSYRNVAPDGCDIQVKLDPCLRRVVPKCKKNFCK